MMVHEITAQAGARPRRKRVGRGESSGMGRTSGRGNKGAQSRSGYKRRWTAEGGQMPIFRRIPKRGFNNFHFRDEFEIVNLGVLNERFEDGAAVTVDVLKQQRLVRGATPLVKILALGALTKKFTIEAHAASAAAREQIEKAGGTLTLIERRDPAALARTKRNQGVRKTRKAAKAAKAAQSG
jgi:large subunit ribosomal protein L15